MRAAQAVARTLEAAFVLREEDADFARDWARALNLAWELVEARVLVRLLAPEDELPVSARILDSKLALAVLQRRHAALPGAGGAGGARPGSEPVEQEAVTRLRAEIRALAGGTDEARL